MASRVPRGIIQLPLNDVSAFSSDTSRVTIVNSHQLYTTRTSMCEISVEGEGLTEANPSGTANDHTCRVEYYWDLFYGAWVTLNKVEVYSKIPSQAGRANGTAEGFFIHTILGVTPLFFRVQASVIPISPAPSGDFIYSTPSYSYTQLDYNVYTAIQWASGS